MYDTSLSLSIYIYMSDTICLRQASLRAQATPVDPAEARVAVRERVVNVVVEVVPRGYTIIHL